MPDPQRGTHRLGPARQAVLVAVAEGWRPPCTECVGLGVEQEQRRAAGCVRADHTNPGVQLKTCPVGAPPGC
jgi:hypothetical protein